MADPASLKAADSGSVEIKVPDLGDAADVEIVEVLVKAGDQVEKDDPLITLESDKASMDVPSPQGGKVREVRVSEGEGVREGTVILVLEGASASAAEGASTTEKTKAPGGSDGKGAPSQEDDSPGETAEPASPSESATDTASPASTKTAAPDLPEADHSCQVVVLGSGPGGYTAAFRAADLGLDVVLVERYATLGGVCLNVGCIPSKALLHVAKLLEETSTFGEHGIRFGKPKIDLDKLRQWKNGVVERLTGGIETMAKLRKVRTLTGTGKLVGPHRMEIQTESGTETLAFEKAILAAGSQSVKIPGFPYDDERLMDSTGALELADIPKRLLVIGGGIIGLEMATVYHALGSEITVVELLPGIMPGADRDLVRPLQKRLKARYARILTKTKVSAIKSQKRGLEVTFEGEGLGDAPAKDTFDRVLLSVGRAPNGKKIGAEAAGIPVTDRGFLETDKQMRTQVEHIFAIGDLVGQPMLAHKAIHEGKVAAEAAAGQKSYFDAKVIPSVAYTDPEVAWVGITEDEAKKAGRKLGKGTFPWSASGRSLAQGRDEGLTKLLFDEETGRVVGGGIVGPHAGDLIAEVALGIEMGADAADIGLTIHPHPTLSESVGLAAEAFEGTITDLMPKKRRAKKG